MYVICRGCLRTSSRSTVRVGVAWLVPKGAGSLTLPDTLRLVYGRVLPRILSPKLSRPLGHTPPVGAGRCSLVYGSESHRLGSPMTHMPVSGMFLYWVKWLTLIYAYAGGWVSVPCWRQVCWVCAGAWELWMLAPYGRWIVLRLCGISVYLRRL